MSLPRYPQFTTTSSRNSAANSQSQTPSQMQSNLMKNVRKTTNTSNIPVPATASKGYSSRTNSSSSYRSKNDPFTEEDFGDDANLSREDCIVLLQPRMQPQGQENLSGNVTPTNPISDQDLTIFERTNPSTTKSRFMSDVTDSPMNTIRYNNAGSNRNSMNIQFQGSNRNSMDHSQSNRSSLDVSQSSYNTLIIHDNENPSSIFRNDSYFSNYSPSPPNASNKLNPKSHQDVSCAVNVKDALDSDQQYLNQSFVLKHLTREANQMQNTPTSSSSQYKSTRDSGLSDNSNNQSSFDGTSLKTKKSKSQPDLTKLSDHQQSSGSSTVNTINNDIEILAMENLKLREQLNECLMKVAKSQKLEQEVSHLIGVHEELVQSCERRERLERTARTRLQSDCRRFQDMNKSLKEQVEGLQQQLIMISTQQQQQNGSATGRNQQDIFLACLVQQNKELNEANKRQQFEIQAQHATLEEQRIHINVLDAALKRLEEDIRQKQLYQKQLQSLIHANEKKEKMQYDLDKEISKKLAQSSDIDVNMSKWLFRGDKDMEVNQSDAQMALDHHNLNKMSQDHDILPSDSQRIVNELQSRLKMVENRLMEKEDTIRQMMQEQKLTWDGKNFNIPSSSSLQSNQLFNPSNYENLASSCATSTKTFSTTSNASLDALLGAYSGMYHQSYGQNLNSSGVSPNTSCSSTSTFQQHHQHPSTSSNASNYLLQNYDEQRKSIDDELKKLDTQLLSKICCFPSNLLSKKAGLGDEYKSLTSNSSDIMLQNLNHMRNQRDSTPTNLSNSSTKAEEIVLLEKHGRSSQKLRSNLAQISSTMGQNMTDISNIGKLDKPPKIVIGMRKDREVSAPPSALPRPPRVIKSSPKKAEFEIGGRLSESDSNKSSLSKQDSEKNLIKRHQSPSDFSSPQSTLRKNYGTMKTDSSNNLANIYYTNKPTNYVSTKSYQRLPESPRSNTANSPLQRFGAATIGSKSMQFVKNTPPVQNQFLINDSSSSKAWKIDREGSASSNFAHKPDMPTIRSRTQTPPKFLNLSRDKSSLSGGGAQSNQSSPTKATLPSAASVLYNHRSQSAQTGGEWKRTTNVSPKRDGSAENRYRIQF